MAIRLRRQGGGASSSALPKKPSGLEYGEPAVSSKGDLYIGNGTGGVTELISENGGQTINGNLNIEGDLEVGGDLIAQLTSQIFLQIYPIGSLYITTSNTNPGSIFGGTWEKIQGRFLFGSDSSHAVNSTGGTSSHTHTTAAHTLTINEVPGHSHTVNNHTHDFSGTTSSDGWGYVNFGDCTSPWNFSGGGNISVSRNTQMYMLDRVLQQVTDGNLIDGFYVNNHTHTYSGTTGGSSPNTDSRGGGGAHSHGNTGSSSHLPPYLAVNIWKRTA